MEWVIGGLSQIIMSVNQYVAQDDSVDDNNSVIFMYRSGLSGPPKRF